MPPPLGRVHRESRRKTGWSCPDETRCGSLACETCMKPSVVGPSSWYESMELTVSRGIGEHPLGHRYSRNYSPADSQYVRRY
jgi:hypothetical protein